MHAPREMFLPMQQSTTCCSVLCCPAGDIKEDLGVSCKPQQTLTLSLSVQEPSLSVDQLICRQEQGRRVGIPWNRKGIAGRRQHVLEALQLVPTQHSIITHYSQIVCPAGSSKQSSASPQNEG